MKLQLPRPRPAGTPAAPAAHRRDDRDLHLRDARRAHATCSAITNNAGAQGWWLALIARPDHDGAHGADRLRRLAHAHLGQRAVEDGDVAHGRDGHRDRVLRARRALRPRRVPSPGTSTPPGSILTLVGFVVADARRLARRRGRLRPRHARAQPRRGAGRARGRAGSATPKKRSRRGSRPDRRSREA